VKATVFNVAAWTRRAREVTGIATFRGRDQLPQFLARTEILVNLPPLTPQTQDMLDRTRLHLLPRGASLINLARGHHVVDADLIELLDRGHVAAATLDAFRVEPLPEDHPFWSHPAITITPHASRRLDIAGIARRVAAQWRRAQAGEPLHHLVDRATGY
jgi:glyoxylate/hydroxypyruvate reductase